MKKLPQVVATAEQLPLISQNRLGVEVICGAAGSGKTSTALLRLRSLCFMFLARRERQGSTDPVRVLVLTYNRTLAGYIRALAEHQLGAGLNIELEIETFGRWAMKYRGQPLIVDDIARQKLNQLANLIRVLNPSYIVKEAEYILGRFHPSHLESYLSTERSGRGSLPRVDRPLRQKILEEVINPYREWLRVNNYLDWDGLAVSMYEQQDSLSYDIIIVDETQDFSANQLRAVRHHLGSESATTFVIDTVQRIYARGFTWTETGFDIRPERFHILRANHRNTVEIAAFAAGVLNGVGVEGNGALPDLTAAASHGPLPIVLRGNYSQQLAWTIEFIQSHVDLRRESCAFLKPQGGQWFRAVRNGLKSARIPFVELIRQPEWPEGSENVALSTFHSAKGLEFDYVFIIGFNQENTQYEDQDIDDQGTVLRRLLAVAIARARKQVVVGYKPCEESNLTEYFIPGSFIAQDL